MPYDENKIDPAIKGLPEQHKRLMVHGGNKQQERMIKDKRRSLDHAVYFSYQGADVVRVDAENKQSVKALINPNKLKQDYDDKIISVGYEYKFKCGDVFEWLGTNTHWIIYLQDLTELAYFRGDIRKCSHEIAWEDDEGHHKTYAAIRGPVETKINFLQKHGISLDTPNLSLNILMPKTEAAMKYFKRYSKFYLSGGDICWRVEAIDWLSMPGILEINAVEYYSNEHAPNIVGAGSELYCAPSLKVFSDTFNTPPQESKATVQSISTIFRFTMKIPASVSVNAKTFTPISHLKTSSSTSSYETVSPAGATKEISGTSSAVMTMRTKKSLTEPLTCGGKTSIRGSVVLTSTRVTDWSVIRTLFVSGIRRRRRYRDAPAPVSSPLASSSCGM